MASEEAKKYMKEFREFLKSSKDDKDNDWSDPTSKKANTFISNPPKQKKDK